MNIVKFLLFPFAALYGLVMRVRNHLYDIGHKTSVQFEVPVIVVGNLNVGGSGKTPMVEYLIKLLMRDFKVATLSRGYKRDTKGYKFATATDSARHIGDEPMQLYKKFGKDVHVAVGEDRVFAIPNILHRFPATSVIVLDDAMQHRSVQPKLSILVTDYAHPFYEDFVLPMGRLREARSGANRSDIVVVTKCSNSISQEERKQITQNVQRYAGPKPVFFSSIQYGEIRPLGDEKSINKNVVLVSGIAKPESLKQFCIANYNILKHFDFGDHHRYTVNDLKAVESFYRSHRGDLSIITTEKDMVKLVEPELHPFVEKLPWFYVPIQHQFIEDGLKFDKLVVAAVASDDKNG